MVQAFFISYRETASVELQCIEIEKSAAVEVTQSQVRSNGQDQTSTKNTDKSYDKMKHVLIIGDSMIKHIDPKKLSKKVVQKRSFPGKKTAHNLENNTVNSVLDSASNETTTKNICPKGPKLCRRNVSPVYIVPYIMKYDTIPYLLKFASYYYCIRQMSRTIQ